MNYKVLTLAMICQLATSETIVKLGEFKVHRHLITLSGFSSGGGYAQHLFISHSSLFRGIAVFQHAFYRCGSGDGISKKYDQECTLIGNTSREQMYPPEKSSQEIKDNYKQGLIDNPANLNNTKLYVYTGTNNWIHSPDLSLKILNVYEPYILNPYAIRVRAQAANLTFPTHNYGGPCSEDAKANYYLSNCGLSGAFDALSFLLGPDKVIHSPLSPKKAKLEPLQSFDQTEFTKNIEGVHYMDTVGYLYIPAACKAAKCLLHFYFHGCHAGREFSEDNHIRNSGFLEVAELNKIIMVFPQILSNTGQNRYGCWDTYGLTGKLYATKKGAQVIAVRNMISKILGETFE